ncbi:MAG: branched-chain amino acid ABC transporter permease [Candidatus Dormibacteraeota bacterium]|nr:branched-chain amino acid ABC transporter permease [Candidatus Dormibacteraeota bacterium]
MNLGRERLTEPSPALESVRRARRRLAGPIGTGILALIAVAVIVLLVAPRVVAGGSGFFFQILVYGIADGAIFALIALGYTLVYGIIELINFAHGDIFTLGAFVSIPLLGAFGLAEGGHAGGVQVVLGLLAVFVITMLIIGGVNVTIERVAYRPLRNAPRLAPLITAVGMSFILEGIMYVWRGANNIHYPDLLPGGRVSVAGVNLFGFKDVFVIITAVVLVGLFTGFINLSRLGKAMRATAQDREAALLMGIDINRTISAAFFMGAVLAAAGGIIFGLYFNSIRFDLGFEAGLIAFTAAVFGGIGNIVGAALGGLIIGLIQAFSNAYFATQWSDVIIFGILILVLVFRPTGLLGMRVPEK